MPAIVFIGDETNALGFRLAGVATCSPAPAELHAEFARALATAQWIILGRRCADALAPPVLRRALAQTTPLVVVMPDIVEPRADAGLARRVRAVLGIEG
jgi:vacuolar-type H+-ATPase subunit F/Vma7